jgi:hypothetical protein
MGGLGDNHLEDASEVLHSLLVVHRIVDRHIGGIGFRIVKAPGHLCSLKMNLDPSPKVQNRVVSLIVRVGLCYVDVERVRHRIQRKEVHFHYMSRPIGAYIDLLKAAAERNNPSHEGGNHLLSASFVEDNMDAHLLEDPHQVGLNRHGGDPDLNLDHPPFITALTQNGSVINKRPV